MFFNSLAFILVFLPLTVIGFYVIGAKGHHRVAVSWLVGASLLFYSWWNPAYLSLILLSILFNYAIGVTLTSGGRTNRKLLLIAGISLNLALLGYYKYAFFIIENINIAGDFEFYIDDVALPLAISFFTFQQIAYLVDAYKKETKEYNFLYYCLFVTFFPQLVAGPIVHHKEMMPQFLSNFIYKLNDKNIAIGLTIFTIGLFKKVVIADNAALYANPVFDAVENGLAVTFFDAWLGALAYTFQLYFDFSGYSDMAIGLARLFGIRIPLNFNSPYKAVSIVDFWRRWHMTLSRFLRDYLYFPMGGNRRGKSRRYFNLIITMILGGLWHGASWTFVFWGLLHGLYLIINHIWRSFRSRLVSIQKLPTRYLTVFPRLITFLSVVIAWVFFRSESFQGAWHILLAMSGMNGIDLQGQLNSVSTIQHINIAGIITYPDGNSPIFSAVEWKQGMILISALFFGSMFLPNTQQIMRKYNPAFEVYPGEIKPTILKIFQWRPTLGSAIFFSTILVFTLYSLLTANYVEFIYWSF